MAYLPPIQILLMGILLQYFQGKVMFMILRNLMSNVQSIHIESSLLLCLFLQGADSQVVGVQLLHHLPQVGVQDVRQPRVEHPRTRGICQLISLFSSLCTGQIYYYINSKIHVICQLIFLLFFVFNQTDNSNQIR